MTTTHKHGQQKILVLLLIIVVLSRLAFAFRPEDQLGSRPYSEDAYYVFNIADHLAHGEGFTADGMHPTNGVQPLIVILYTPFFFFTHDKWLAIRLIFGLIALLDE